MDKRQLSRLRKLKKEAEVIKQEIRDLEFKPAEKTMDTAKDYSTGYPVVITIEGFGSEEYVKARNRLYEQLRRKLIAIEKERDALERYIDSIEDPELRTIVRLRYIEGKTLEKIAESMEYSERTIRRKLFNFKKDVL